MNQPCGNELTQELSGYGALALWERLSVELCSVVLGIDYSQPPLHLGNSFTRTFPYSVVELQAVPELGDFHSSGSVCLSP